MHSWRMMILFILSDTSSTSADICDMDLFNNTGHLFNQVPLKSNKKAVTQQSCDIWGFHVTDEPIDAFYQIWTASCVGL